MTNIYNPKLRIKFLRTATVRNTPVEPGNMLIDMEASKIYLDILAADNTVKRINLSGGITWMGTVPTYNDLPKTPENGDMYNVADTGANYVWSESAKFWDKLSENIDLSGLYTKEETNNLFLTKTAASNTYLQKTDAASTYTNKTDFTTYQGAVEDTYAKKTDLSGSEAAISENYLKKVDAESTYTKISDFNDYKTTAEATFASEANLTTLTEMLNNAIE